MPKNFFFTIFQILSVAKCNFLNFYINDSYSYAWYESLYETPRAMGERR